MTTLDRPRPEIVPVRDKLCWSYDEVAAMVGVDRWTVKKMVAIGTLPQPRRNGRRRLFLAAEVRKAIEALST